MTVCDGRATDFIPTSKAKSVAILLLALADKLRGIISNNQGKVKKIVII
jgi:hypothetical protein